MKIDVPKTGVFTKEKHYLDVFLYLMVWLAEVVTFN